MGVQLVLMHGSTHDKHSQPNKDSQQPPVNLTAQQQTTELAQPLPLNLPRWTLRLIYYLVAACYHAS